MRKFKFRVWNHDENKFASMVNDYLRFGFDEILTIPLSKKDTYIIQQFTGLQDPGGKDIYEGDILEISTNYRNRKESRYGLVHYHFYEYLVGVYDPAYSKDRMVNNNYCSILNAGRVAGNVFENRELLLR